MGDQIDISKDEKKNQDKQIEIDIYDLSDEDIPEGRLILEE